jgi:hypothetical protein
MDPAHKCNVLLLPGMSEEEKLILSLDGDFLKNKEATFVTFFKSS